MTRGRRITANLSLTLDGRYHGPAGPDDFEAFIPYVTTDVSRDHMARMCEEATTAVLSRANAEHFMDFWPRMADDPTADPRDRTYAKWLLDAQKVVFSTTVTKSPWDRTRMVNGPAAEIVKNLTGTVLINSSPSVLKPLLKADLVDRLYVIVCPEITGGGQRLFEEGLPRSKWTLTDHEVGGQGEMAMTYDRAR
ncbi:dihydrofolate reductase family protein [Amycolatopsis nalaikhensis]|uniref:Dihydrofolate reductase family protein n=1 Tax=Amycolatopsis nalaikhensis TaxID=715472 RepID=A0ABY8XCM1_9PSEU|nr:dihydrofolate reductase family protein [Amycolatopsis sp. 2-2]WIV53273.1 dihydrofolate reductase family protein [Amycolatopsis sp. 2-2]